VREPALEVFRLSGAKEPALDTFLLVGADNDERLAGMFGGKSMVRTECPEAPDSDIVLFRGGRLSKCPGSLYLEDCDNGAEVRDVLRFVLRLLVDLRDGALEDLVDERLSGMTTTGIPPLFRISRRDLPLDDLVLTVPFDARLLCFFSGIRPLVWCSS